MADAPGRQPKLLRVHRLYQGPAGPSVYSKDYSFSKTILHVAARSAAQAIVLARRRAWSAGEREGILETCDANGEWTRWDGSKEATPRYQMRRVIGGAWSEQARSEQFDLPLKRRRKDRRGES